MTACTDPSSPGARPSLRRHRDFRRYLTGQAAGVTGSSISAMVIPVLAVLELDATTAEVAWLTFLGQLPPALLAGGLGTWIGVRPTLIVGTCLLVVLYRSPLRSLPEMPGPPSAPPPPPGARAQPAPSPSGTPVPNPTAARDVRHDRSSGGSQ
ncbi:hypothetical protein ACFYW8_36425 [Streptomyces sp. NPDC002742]|uniref:hypothetical protein n=1 Tax=Streptomyces sp. NPDC002742 TaxID=3364663 RepID=UPI00369D0F03